MARSLVTFDTTGFKSKMKRLEKTIEPRLVMREIGLEVLAWIDKNFEDEGTESKWPKLRPKTTKGKSGDSKALQRTGDLKDSLTKPNRAILQISDRTITIGSLSKKAQIHHGGADIPPLKPKNARALRFQSEEGIVYRVSTKGARIPQRKLLPSRKVVREIGQKVINRKLKEATAGAK